jgi:G3E family GTPase
MACQHCGSTAELEGGDLCCTTSRDIWRDFTSKLKSDETVERIIMEFSGLPQDLAREVRVRHERHPEVSWIDQANEVQAEGLESRYGG